MTLINDHRPAPQPEYTRPVPRYTLAILDEAGQCIAFVPFTTGIPETPGPKRLAILRDGLIIAHTELEEQ